MATLSSKYSTDAAASVSDSDGFHIVENVTSGAGTTKVALISQLKTAIEKTTLKEQASDPADPVDGESVIWQSNGDSANAGDEGDIMIKITVGVTTKTTTIVNFSEII